MLIMCEIGIYGYSRSNIRPLYKQFKIRGILLISEYRGPYRKKRTSVGGSNDLQMGQFFFLIFFYDICTQKKKLQLKSQKCVIFETPYIPTNWAYSKLLVIFKKGLRLLCGNYRGISINDVLYRIFDKILYNRLTLWYVPSREQAGCQKNRGCADQIIALRLLTDYSKKSRKKLFLLFIDFEKAYDKVPRMKLLGELKRLGCGRVFLTILSLIYSNIKLVFQSASISTSIGVRQGAATSCMLFIIYLDIMVRGINDVEDDGFLGSLHALLLMDDTVLLATSRKRLIEKFKIVQLFCSNYGMSLNTKKTKFMVINHSKEDKVPIISRGFTVVYSSAYLYLGTFISDDGNYKTVLNLHMENKRKHVLKYVAFVDKNSDLPFCMKKKVAESCIFSSILYGCESWLCSSYGSMEMLYMGVLKSLLGVRKTTCSDLCLVESGFLSLSAEVDIRRTRFFQRKCKDLQDDSILTFTMQLASSLNTSSSKLIRDMLNSQLSKDDYRNQVRAKVRQSNSSKRITYVTMNPTLEVPSVYRNRFIPEYKRVKYSKLRLSSHDLRIETGRWCRIPRERRLCKCLTDVQTEEHALLFCVKTEFIRQK